MTEVLISIPDQVADKLRERASARGLPLDAYTSKLVERVAQEPSLEEILAPIQTDFARSGMTETDLLELGRELLEKVRAGKQE